MKNILVITGSPRKDGNSTLLANAFIEGAKSVGNEVMLFEAGKMKINGCIACRTCFKNGKACSFDDDFNKLVPLIEKADIIVFCTPLYWFSFPAQLKSAIDKLYSFLVGKKELKIKEAILIVCAGDNTKTIFKGITASYKLILKYQGWKNRDILTVNSVHEIEDMKTETLEKAKNIGLNIS
jgi:multimeric flavodoxin WrbA